MPVVRELSYEPVDRDGLPLDSPPAALALEGACEVGTPFGTVVVVEHTFDTAGTHGSVALEGCDLVDEDALATLTGRPVEWPDGGARRPVFFDLETTGLSGGAGTVAFLVGCGFFEAGAFKTVQFFLPGFAAERALLHAAGELLDRVPLLVTYNGRSFDVPVMEMRWSFHRMACPIERTPHVDMLPPARRLWREAGDGAERSCRLVSLEEHLFGFVRTGDVPGWEIPQRYFAYLRSGDSGPLAPVLHHNRLDLLSLAVVAARAQRLVQDGHEAARDARECHALGRLYERAGKLEVAESAYAAAADHIVGDREVRERALARLAVLLRRQRRFRESADAWRRLLALGHGRSSRAREALEALAIHHEHRVGELDAARSIALSALQEESDPIRREAVRHRLARLERKLAGRRDVAAPSPSPLFTGPADPE